jgi:hypothetical protein
MKFDKGVVAGLSAAVVGTQVALADEFGTDIASSGNGGVATSSANGGAVGTGNINSGGNAGNAIGIGDTYGSVAADGGDVANSTTLDVSANGGTAISDASGGNYNLAFVS